MRERNEIMIVKIYWKSYSASHTLFYINVLLVWALQTCKTKLLFIITPFAIILFKLQDQWKWGHTPQMDISSYNYLVSPALPATLLQASDPIWSERNIARRKKILENSRDMKKWKVYGTIIFFPLGEKIWWEHSKSL